MKGIILAAGRGSRMKTLTDDRPKCLVELNGKSLLDRQIASLRAAGLTELGIVTGYRRELLADRGLVEFHNPRWAETNMVASLECAQEWLLEGPCIVSYSDIFYSSEAVVSLMHCDAPLAVTYDPNWLAMWERRFGDPLLDAETFRLSSRQTLVEIGNKPASVGEVEGQYMGLLRFTPDGWKAIARIREGLNPDSRDRMHMTGTLQQLIDRGKLAITAIPYVGEWGEIDSVEDLQNFTKGESH